MSSDAERNHFLYRHITACTQRCGSGFCLFNVWKGATCVPAALSLPLTGSTQSVCVYGIGSDTESGKYADKHDKRQEQGNCFFMA